MSTPDPTALRGGLALPLPGSGPLGQTLGDDWREYLHFFSQLRPVASTPNVSGQVDDLDLEGASILRLRGTREVIGITGIAGGTNGRQVIIANIGLVRGGSVVLIHQSPASRPEHRLDLPATTEVRDVGIEASASVLVWYDGISERWRMIRPGFSLQNEPDPDDPDNPNPDPAPFASLEIRGQREGDRVYAQITVTGNPATRSFEYGLGGFFPVEPTVLVNQRSVENRRTDFVVHPGTNVQVWLSVRAWSRQNAEGRQSKVITVARVISN